MKRVLCVLAMACIAASFAACGDNPSSSAGEATTAQILSTENNVLDPNEEVYVIKTDVVDLKYPSKWEKKVKTVVKDNKVSFSVKDKDVKLFDLYFGGEEGYAFGTLETEGKPELRVVSYDIDNGSDNFDEYCAMQEDINVIFQYLIKDGLLTEK